MNILPSAMIKKPIIRLKRGSKAYKDLQIAVLERDNYACQECGCYTMHSPHHIVFLSQNGSDTMDNMVTLCGFFQNNCHRKAHDHKLRITKK